MDNKAYKFLVFGNYSVGNLGDDVLLKSTLKGILNFFPNSIAKVAAGKKPADCAMLPTGLRSFFAFKWLKTLYILYKTDVVVFGGGGLLNIEEPKSILIWGNQIFWAKLFKCKVVLLANSITPNNSEVVTKILKKIDFITVRDSASFRYLQKLNLEIPIKQTADLSFNFDVSTLITDKFEFDSDEFVVLNLREYQHVDFEVQLEFFLRLVKYITEKTVKSIYLMPFAPADIKFLRELNNEVKDNGRVFLLPLEPDIILSAIKQSELVISQRLHPLLFGLQLNKKIVALSYNSKVSSLLLDLNLAEYCFEIDLENLELILATVKSALSEETTELVNLSEVQKKAEDNFRLLDLFLE
jgi:polysaccharide pyruvyl transferase CsaB